MTRVGPQRHRGGRGEAVLWLRPLFGLSSRRPLFNPRPVHVTFVLKIVSLGQVFIPVLQFPPVYRYTNDPCASSSALLLPEG